MWPGAILACSPNQVAAAPVLQLHVVSATASFAIGAMLLARAKSRMLHIVPGCGWRVTTAATVISSF